MKLISIFLVLTFAILANSQEKINKRQKKQMSRIEQGLKSGELNKKERKELVKGQKKIQKMKRKAKRDGKVTRKEKARIKKAQNHQSKKIYRKKHNNKN